MNEAMAPPDPSEAHAEDAPAPSEIPLQATLAAESAAGAESMPAWRVALLVGSSVLLSGIAVVLWNRRALERMRQSYAAAPSPEDPEEFI